VFRPPEVAPSGSEVRIKGLDGRSAAWSPHRPGAGFEPGSAPATVPDRMPSELKSFGRRVLLLLVLLSTPAGADDVPTSEACLACHGSEGFAAPDGRPLAINAESFNASAHSALPCTTCHTDATEIPHAEPLKRPGLSACDTCHSGAVAAYRASIHGKANGQGVKEAASCMDCHGNIHALFPHTDPRSAAHWTNMTATCARCHANLELSKKFGIPIVRPVEAYLDSAHGRRVAAGKRAAVCSDCHGTHDIRPAADPSSSVWRSNVPETCGKCHVDIFTAYRDSVHGVAAARGVRESPVCTDCHGEHRILPHTEAASPVFAANIPRETCGRCHGDTRLSSKYGLSLEKVTAFQDSYHGLALRAGRATVANCSSCHGVHDILPSSDPRSHVNPANLAATCGRCHPGAGTRFTLGSVHAAATTTGGVIVSWIRVIYLSLIVLTIGFMAAHNLLDFIRKLRRGTPPPGVVPPGQPDRMSRAFRWQHGLVLISFPVLVYTGFALKYPENWWAAPLLGWETHWPLRGYLHRAAAIVLLIAVVWHLVQLALSRRMRARMHGFMMSFKDLRDLFAALAYYVGLRATPPHMGEFSYIEKAEYWAFMWGIGVMTVTGFMLWFENATLFYLPGWAADVATAVHFYEAILATLAVLVWHFYWVIFDPDVYPADRSFITGRAPASRVAERAGGHPSREQPPANGKSQ